MSDSLERIEKANQEVVTYATQQEEAYAKQREELQQEWKGIEEDNRKILSTKEETLRADLVVKKEALVQEINQEYDTFLERLKMKDDALKDKYLSKMMKEVEDTYGGI